MYLYVCMRLCMFVCMHVCMYVRAGTKTQDHPSYCHHMPARCTEKTPVKLLWKLLLLLSLSFLLSYDVNPLLLYCLLHGMNRHKQGVVQLVSGRIRDPVVPLLRQGRRQMEEEPAGEELGPVLRVRGNVRISRIAVRSV